MKPVICNFSVKLYTCRSATLDYYEWVFHDYYSLISTGVKHRYPQYFEEVRQDKVPIRIISALEPVAHLPRMVSWAK